MTESAMMVVIVGFMIAVIFVAAKKSKARTQAQVNEANQNGSQEHNFCKRLNSMRERVIADVFKGESACECDGSKNYFKLMSLRVNRLVSATEARITSS